MASTLLEGHKKRKPTNDDDSPKTEKCDNSSLDMEDGEGDDGDDVATDAGLCLSTAMI